MPPNQMPSFDVLVNIYGPYLGLILFLLICLLIAQFYWFSRVIKAKNDEIERLVKREEDVSKRLLHLVDEKIGYKEPRKPKP